MQLIEIAGATILDGVSDHAVTGKSVWIEGDRIVAVEGREQAGRAADQVIDAAGKFVIPGLMDANVHLLLDIRLENLARHEDHFEALILEAAQIALKNGLTTVFDTWGPRAPLMAVRDRINSGKAIASRIYCAGNIVGLDGPYSKDFLWRALDIASGDFVSRINALWAENVGPELSWETPERVGEEIRKYLESGIDFLKYAASEHRAADPAAFLAFSPVVQEVIVNETHRAGLTAQAHTFSVEAVRVAVEAGCDIIQHCNLTGPVPIPDKTLELLASKGTAATIFPFTKRRLAKIMQAGTHLRVFSCGDRNISNLVSCGANILLATDAGVLASEAATDPVFGKSWIAAGEDNLAELGQGHFHWMTAMEERGYPPMAILRAATSNIAKAYKVDGCIGTIAAGKTADLLILAENPLSSAANYRKIDTVMKAGQIVDRNLLPDKPVLTLPRPAPNGVPRPHFHSQSPGFPFCC